MKLTQKNYFSRSANLKFMSVSQFKSFEKCPASALAEVKGKFKREETTSLLVGSYVDSYFEGTLANFIKKHPDIFKKDGTLKADYLQAEEIIKRILKDRTFKKHMSGEKQVIMTGSINGVPVKIKIDSFHPGKQIDDLKIVKDFQPIYHPERGMLPWFEYWDYDLQGAIYQEIVRQNTGEKLPFYLDAATKEKDTDIDIVHINQKTLDFALDRFKQKVEMFDAMKQGIITPDRCEQCAYCKRTKKIKTPTDSDEFYLI
jgi:predicted Zn-ribbon and HTH transcriptional regulator